ncbi:MAG TPA: alpha/beta hydrolase [Polyangiaceae bacterium]
MAWFVVYLWLSVVSVAFARLRRGPLRPSWTFGYEVVTRAQKRFHERVARLEPAEERKAWASLKGQNPSSKRVTWTRSARGDVDCIDINPRQRISSERVILYLHGGGFLYGSERSHGELCSRIALSAEARLVFPLYRLAPEHPFPSALEDVLAVYRALLESGTRPSDVVVAGDSAGGNLALALLLTLRDRGEALPARAVLLSPCVDLTDRSGSIRDNEPFDWASPWMFDRWQREYLSGKDPGAPLASPARAELRGLPPLLLQIGTAEMLYDQVTSFARVAQASGVEVTLEEYPDRVHLWHALAPMFPEFQASIDRIGEYALARGSSRAMRVR